MAEEKSKAQPEEEQEPTEDTGSKLEEVAQEAADKISVKHGRDVQPSKATIAELAAERSDEDKEEEFTADESNEGKPVSQFSTDLSTDPLKDDEDVEEKQGDVQPQIKEFEPEFPEIPKELRVNDLVKAPKDLKKLKATTVYIAVGLVVGFVAIYVMRLLELI